MLKKILIVLVLMISVFGCSSKKYTVETVDYLSILPSVDEIYRYQVLGMDDDEIFVSYNKDICTLVNESITFDDGSSEVVEKNICNLVVETIYAISINTKEYRIVDSNVGDNYIYRFYPMNDNQFIYGLTWYDVNEDVSYDNIYFDSLNASKPIIYNDEILEVSSKLPLFGASVLDGIAYFTRVENEELYLYAVSSPDDVTRKLVETNINYEEYTEMLPWNQYIAYYKDDGTIIYDIEDASYTMIPNKDMRWVISILDNKVYGKNHDDKFYYYDLLTNESIQFDENPVAISEEMILFDDEIWYVENNQYKKEEIEYKVKGQVSSVLYTKDCLVLVTDWLGIEEEMIIIKRK